MFPSLAMSSGLLWGVSHGLSALARECLEGRKGKHRALGEHHVRSRSQRSLQCVGERPVKGQKENQEKGRHQTGGEKARREDRWAVPTQQRCPVRDSVAEWPKVWFESCPAVSSV